MSYRRHDFIRLLREDYFETAIREYACIRIANHINKPDLWSRDVEMLLSDIRIYMNNKIIKTTFKDREAALKEAMNPAAICYAMVQQAKHTMAVYYPKKKREIMKMNLDVSDIFAEMISKYIPDYSYLLDDLRSSK